MENIMNYYDYYINKLIEERNNNLNYIYSVMIKHNYDNLPTLYNHKLKIKYKLIKKENNNNTYFIDKETVKNMIKNSIKITLDGFNYIINYINFNIIISEIKNDYIILNLEIIKPTVTKNNLHIFDSMVDKYKTNDIKTYIEMFNIAYPELKYNSSFLLKEMTELEQ